MDAVKQLSSVNTLSGSPEELSIHAINQLAMAGLVDTDHFQSGQLHHLQPAPQSSLVVPKQEYQPNFGEHEQTFAKVEETDNPWRQDIKVEQQACHQYQQPAAFVENFAQDREEGALTMEYSVQRPEYSFLGSSNTQYGGVAQFRDVAYTGMTDQEHYINPIGGFPEVDDKYIMCLV